MLRDVTGTKSDAHCVCYGLQSDSTHRVMGVEWVGDSIHIGSMEPPEDLQQKPGALSTASRHGDINGDHQAGIALTLDYNTYFTHSQAGLLSGYGLGTQQKPQIRGCVNTV